MNTLTHTLGLLESARDPQTQVSLLQRLNDLLLTQYCINIHNQLRIYPLWVEAYYYHPDKFPDPNTHRVPHQQNRFGRLYFHTKGWGGVDLCLSRGDYCLCFLLKYSHSAGVFYSQIPLRRALEPYRPGLRDRPVLCPLPPEDRDGLPVYHSVRKGLKPGLFAGELLASLKGIHAYKYSYAKGYGKTRLLAEGPAAPPTDANGNSW